MSAAKKNRPNKDEHATVRFGPSETKIIDQIRDETGMSRSAVVRLALHRLMATGGAHGKRAVL